MSQGFFQSSIVQTDKPVGSVARCGACGLFKHCQSPKMKPYGDGRKRVLVVGEVPGESEDEEGRPFVGKAGALLRDHLGSLGIRLDRDAISTNALICHPSRGMMDDPKRIDYCRPNLLETIKDVNPHVVITLGHSALKSVLYNYWNEVGPLERWVGWKIPLQDFWLCPTYHPSYLLRMKNELFERLFSDHLETAFGLKEPPPKQEDWKSQVECIFEERRVWQALKDIDAEGGWVAVDYEGNCLKPEYPRAKAVSFSVSNGRRTISYPWVGGNIENTGKFLRSKRTKKIASNMKMEERWTVKMFGHRVRNWGWDTMLAAHCLDNRSSICSLKFQALVKLGVPSYNDNIEPYLKSDSGGHYNRIHEIDIKQLLIYGGLDSLLEHRLAMVQRKEMGFHG